MMTSTLKILFIGGIVGVSSQDSAFKGSNTHFNAEVLV